MLQKGKFIVIEGTDGSGKDTQTKILFDRLRYGRFWAEKISFPQYQEESSKWVRKYLAGDLGSPQSLGAFGPSTFFAMDRFGAAPKIRAWLEEGKMVLADRYVDSNAGHQGGKIQNQDIRSDFLKWLYELEYDVLKIPRPDLNIILHVPSGISYELKEKQRKEQGLKQDAHEIDLGHLERAEESYLWLAKEFPEGHVLIECAPDGWLMAPQEIHEKIWQVIEPMIKN